MAVIGLGGLGLSAVAVAKTLGATVYGVDINTAVFDTAREQGAAECFANIGEVPTPIDAVLDFAGMGTTTAEAIAAVKPGGRVVVVGLGAPEANIPTHLLVTKNVQLRGSLGASIPDLEAVLELLATGQIVPAIEEVPFAEVPAALARIEAGQVQGAW